MNRLIYRYLTDNFILINDNIRAIDSKCVLSSSRLVKELNKIFGLNKKELKWYIKGWAKKQSKSFNFNEWWTPPNKYIPYLPIVRGISPSLITSELVEVIPYGSAILYVLSNEY